MSFALEDLTQELFDRVVFLEQHRSSGLGGAGGNTNVLIRDDYYEQISSAYEKGKESNRFVSGTQVRIASMAMLRQEI